MLYFWASWCDMSREELPAVQTMYDQYGEDCGFIVASVEAENTVSTVEALKQTLGLTTLPMGAGGLNAFLSYEQPGGSVFCADRRGWHGSRHALGRGDGGRPVGCAR